MDQKVLSPFANPPQDILKCLFDFCDTFTLIEITQVNKAWYSVVVHLLPHALFERYHKKFSLELSESCLLDALCDWVESPRLNMDSLLTDAQYLFNTDLFHDLFSEDQQKFFFQQFKQKAWGIETDSSESPLQFVICASKVFEEG